MLNKTSRSFAFVIRELGDELRDAVALFYLVLRALDTVEDDMSFNADEKVVVLRAFHEHLFTPGWTFTRCGEGFEKTLLVEFDRVIDSFLNLRPEYQGFFVFFLFFAARGALSHGTFCAEVIRDITQRMGEGMAEFLGKTVDSMADWDRYCYYVAGLVGIGLSRLFAASGKEDAWFATCDDLANSMGLFLQKTNIIRDYLEDINDNRIFWPAATWTKYASKLDAFKAPQHAREAVHCLNDLITNALQHLPDCLEYMSRLKDPRNFAFCAIPQIMAIGTLSLCYNNHGVFTGVVKMRRGESAKILLGVEGGIPVVAYYMYHYVLELQAKIVDDDPNAARTRAICAASLAQLEPQLGPELLNEWSTSDYVAAGVLGASALFLARRRFFSRM